MNRHFRDQQGRLQRFQKFLSENLYFSPYELVQTLRLRQLSGVQLPAEWIISSVSTDFHSVGTQPWLFTVAIVLLGRSARLQNQGFKNYSPSILLDRKYSRNLYFKIFLDRTIFGCRCLGIITYIHKNLSCFICGIWKTIFIYPLILNCLANHDMVKNLKSFNYLYL